MFFKCHLLKGKIKYATHLSAKAHPFCKRSPLFYLTWIAHSETLGWLPKQWNLIQARFSGIKFCVMCIASDVTHWSSPNKTVVPYAWVHIPVFPGLLWWMLHTCSDKEYVPWKFYQGSFLLLLFVCFSAGNWGGIINLQRLICTCLATSKQSEWHNMQCCQGTTRKKNITKAYLLQSLTVPVFKDHPHAGVLTACLLVSDNYMWSIWSFIQAKLATLKSSTRQWSWQWNLKTDQNQLQWCRRGRRKMF